MNVYSYPHHINDWRRKTAHLSMEQKGLYREILDALYERCGRLPADIRQLGRIVGVQTRSERKNLEIIATTFLQKDGEYFVQKRTTEELQKIRERSEKASASVGARYNKNNNMTSTNVERTNYERSTSHKPIANNSSLTASPVLTSAREAVQADKKIFEEKEILSAKRGEPSWSPERADSDVLPGGWSDMAEALSIPDEQIYRSWAKFKITSSKPFQRHKWRGWIARENGATKPQLEAAE